MLSPTSASVGHRGYHHLQHQHLPPGCLTDNSDMRGELWGDVVGTSSSGSNQLTESA